MYNFTPKWPTAIKKSTPRSTRAHKYIYIYNPPNGAILYRTCSETDLFTNEVLVTVIPPLALNTFRQVFIYRN